MLHSTYPNKPYSFKTVSINEDYSTNSIYFQSPGKSTFIVTKSHKYSINKRKFDIFQNIPVLFEVYESINLVIP